MKRFVFIQKKKKEMKKFHGKTSVRGHMMKEAGTCLSHHRLNINVSMDH